MPVMLWVHYIRPSRQNLNLYPQPGCWFLVTRITNFIFGQLGIPTTKRTATFWKTLGPRGSELLQPTRHRLPQATKGHKDKCNEGQEEGTQEALHHVLKGKRFVFQPPKKKLTCLGGWTNPFRKNTRAVKLDRFPHKSRWKYKMSFETNT